MNVIFTCGGTGGHINPAIAVANIVAERHPDANILFIGAEGHMEEQLVPQAGYQLKTLPGSGLSRSLSLAGIKKNAKAIKCVLGAVSRCKKIIREFDADVIVGTGGYASFPALYAGSKLGIPTIVHEANAVPGLTTKLAANIATRVLVCFEESRKYYKKPEEVEVVGMPVRKEFLETTREAARAELGLTDEKLVVSAFGSQGASAMNRAMADLMALDQDTGRTGGGQLVAGCGAGTADDHVSGSHQSRHVVDVLTDVDGGAVLEVDALLLDQCGHPLLAEGAGGVDVVEGEALLLLQSHQVCHGTVHGRSALAAEGRNH